MYTLENLPVKHRLADIPIEMPIDYILALPPYVTNVPSKPVFQLPQTIQNLLGSDEWSREKRIIVPYFWTPGWTEEQLNLSIPIDAPPPTRFSPEQEFPGMGRLAFPGSPEYKQFEIVHFVGRVQQLPNGQFGLDLGTSLTLSAEYLDVALQTARTRLMILQTDSHSDFARAILLGRYLVERGGPITLVVTSTNSTDRDNFYTSLLAEIVHNEFPQQLTQSIEAASPDLEFWLVSGVGSQELFKFDRYVAAVNERFAQLRDRVASSQENLEQSLDASLDYLHNSQRERLSALVKQPESLATIQADFASIEQNLTSAAEPWEHESGGAIPLVKAAAKLEELDALTTESPYEAAIRAELEDEKSRAPRVLNANFASPRTQSIIVPDSSLRAGEEYDLLIDIGPRWSKIRSIVSGNAEFPEKALEPDPNGYVIQVVIVSDDFSPSMTSVEIWVPRSTGRSHPFVNRLKAEKPGPIAIKLRAPTFPKKYRKALLTSRARLNLYYENNLLQSAIVTAGVTRGGGDQLEQPNSVEVDYVLSGGFQRLEEDFATRQIAIGSSGSIPVQINLAMNDSGDGSHRFIVKGRLNGSAGVAASSSCPPYAAVSYDPESAKNDLEGARQQLLDCIYKRNKNGDVGKKPKLGLGDKNRRDLVDFKWDLFHLANFGSTLWANAFDQARTDRQACSSDEWQDSLKTMLANPSLIQVSHIGQAQYIFPWALVYEYPLNLSEDWKFCDIVSEEWADGIRKAGEAETTDCKYRAERWHAKNVICPYGFWGLKHVIEEPLSEHLFEDERRVGNVSHEIKLSGPLTLGMAHTSDPDLKKGINDHVQNLKKNGVQFMPVNPALDWISARTMLRAPEIVYFLCHGEYDLVEKDDYLSIGPRTKIPDAKYCIYNIKTLARAWRRDPLDGPDKQKWKQQGPLIFINGCHTTNLRPGKVISFASTFTQLGARGVLGTEISVALPVATDFAELLFQKISPPICMPLGKALRAVRWELANKGNLLGLAYTLYGLADLKLVT